jgi:hypothetical protein
MNELNPFLKTVSKHIKGRDLALKLFTKPVNKKWVTVRIKKNKEPVLEFGVALPKVVAYSNFPFFDSLNGSSKAFTIDEESGCLVLMWSSKVPETAGEFIDLLLPKPKAETGTHDYDYDNEITPKKGEHFILAKSVKVGQLFRIDDKVYELLRCNPSSATVRSTGKHQTFVANKGEDNEQLVNIERGGIIHIAATSLIDGVDATVPVQRSVSDEGTARHEAPAFVIRDAKGEIKPIEKWTDKDVEDSQKNRNNNGTTVVWKEPVVTKRTSVAEPIERASKPKSSKPKAKKDSAAEFLEKVGHIRKGEKP